MVTDEQFLEWAAIELERWVTLGRFNPELGKRTYRLTYYCDNCSDQHIRRGPLTDVQQAATLLILMGYPHVSLADEAFINLVEVAEADREVAEGGVDLDHMHPIFQDGGKYLTDEFSASLKEAKINHRRFNFHTLWGRIRAWFWRNVYGPGN